MLCGLSELTEIAYIRAQEFDVQLIGIWDPNTSIRTHLDLPVWSVLKEVPSYEACILTGIEETSEIYTELLIINEIDHIFVPDILRLRTPKK